MTNKSGKSERISYPLNEFVWEPDGEPMDPSLQEEWAQQAPERERAARKETRDRLTHQINLKYKDIAELTDQIAKLDDEDKQAGVVCSFCKATKGDPEGRCFGMCVTSPEEKPWYERS